MANDYDFDFGFSSVSDEELLQATANIAQDKADKMYKMILPLLDNLAKDADKHDHIRWPNRGKKIQDFKVKLKKILDS